MGCPVSEVQRVDPAADDEGEVPQGGAPGDQGHLQIQVRETRG